MEDLIVGMRYGEMEEILKSILEEMQYQTKLIETAISEGGDLSNRQKKRNEEARDRMMESISGMFKGSPMEDKMKTMMKTVTDAAIERQ